jgi:nucleoside-diphosphate-sugar epimerase
MTPRPPSPPVLVLGATSLIGGFLTARLQAECFDFIEVSRNPPRLDRRWLQADLGDPDLAARLPPLHTVYSLSPIWLLAPALEALHGAGMKRLVAFSSTSRFTKTDSPEASERVVAQRLLEAEAAAETFCAAHDIAWTILRPTMIYAEGKDANVSRLAGLIRRFGFLPISGAGAGLRQPVHADDLAEAAMAAAAAPSARNRAYDLPGGETLTYRQMVVRIFQGLQRPPRIVAMPPWLWRAAFALARPAGATAAMGARMGQDLVFDGADAARDFNWRPRPFLPVF